MNYTNGPWSISSDEAAVGPVIRASDGMPLAIVKPLQVHKATGMVKQLSDADAVSIASLMAAAPDMLELLIADLNQRTGGDPVDYYRAVAGPRERETLRKHLIVIAKARGKSTFGNDWMEVLPT